MPLEKSSFECDLGIYLSSRSGSLSEYLVILGNKVVYRLEVTARLYWCYDLILVMRRNVVWCDCWGSG